MDDFHFILDENRSFSRTTLFSNGKGDGSDTQSNGFANKWAINMNTSGNLTLESEGNTYSLTSKTVADNAWHHVTLLFNRISSLNLCRC
jgi:hypothetical protein